MRNKAVTSLLAVLAVCSVSQAFPTLNFSQGVGGGWNFDGAGTFSFDDPIDITSSSVSAGDTLAGSQIELPDLIVGGSGPVYSLTPNGDVVLRSSGTEVLRGTLGTGDLIPFLSTGLSYTTFQADLMVTAVNNSIGSTFLNLVEVGMKMDLSLTFQGAGSFAQMLENNEPGGNGMEGQLSLIIPAPSAILLASLGLGLVGAVNRNRKLESAA